MSLSNFSKREVATSDVTPPKEVNSDLARTRNGGSPLGSRVLKSKFRHAVLTSPPAKFKAKRASCRGTLMSDATSDDSVRRRAGEEEEEEEEDVEAEEASARQISSWVEPQD